MVCVYLLYIPQALFQEHISPTTGNIGCWLLKLTADLSLGITLGNYPPPRGAASPQDYLAPPQGQLKSNVCKTKARPPWRQTPKGHPSPRAPIGSPSPSASPAFPTPLDRREHSLESSPKIDLLQIKSCLRDNTVTELRPSLLMTVGYTITKGATEKRHAWNGMCYTNCSIFYALTSFILEERFSGNFVFSWFVSLNVGGNPLRKAKSCISTNPGTSLSVVWNKKGKNTTHFPHHKAGENLQLRKLVNTYCITQASK